MATLVQYRARFSEHDAIDNTVIEQYLDDANTDVASGEFGDRLTRAQLYYAAHHVATDPVHGALSTAVAADGAVSSRKIGDVEVTFATAQSTQSTVSQDDLTTSIYGRRYLAILNTSIVGFRNC